jgi:formate/nitrite transporter FocA (FNT family)
MKALSTVLKGLLAGICIGIGAAVYLALLPDHKPLGAFCFAIGLFLIFTYSFNLYTGKIGFLVENGFSMLPELGFTWLGNFAGATLVGAILRLFAREGAAAAWREKAEALCETKLADSFGEHFVLALFCGFLMFVAADSYKKIENPVGKYIGTFLPVAVFILAGFEHVVANMAYFAFAGIFNGKMLLAILAATLGNSVGAFVVPAARRFYTRVEKGAQK